MSKEKMYFIYMKDDEVCFYGPYENEDAIKMMEDLLDNDNNWDCYTMLTETQLDNLLKLNKSDSIVI